MKTSVPERLAKIENELKAMKSQYPVAASLVEFKKTVSQRWSFSAQGGSNVAAFEAKFSPSNSADSLVNIYPEVSNKSDFSNIYALTYFFSKPAASDGAITCRVLVWVPAGGGKYTWYIRFFAIGSSGGNFSRV